MGSVRLGYRVGQMKLVLDPVFVGEKGAEWADMRGVEIGG